MAKYRCEVCYFVYDEEREGTRWEDLPEGWICPVCESPRSVFVPLEDKAAGPVGEVSGKEEAGIEGQAPTMTVSECMVETMIHWGVKHVFGMVGHSNLGLADAIRKHHEAGRLFFIGIRHEGAAAFAASAYGKLTGKPAGSCVRLRQETFFPGGGCSGPRETSGPAPGGRRTGALSH